MFRRDNVINEIFNGEIHQLIKMPLICQSSRLNLPTGKNAVLKYRTGPTPMQKYGLVQDWWFQPQGKENTFRGVLFPCTILIYFPLWQANDLQKLVGCLQYLAHSWLQAYNQKTDWNTMSRCNKKDEPMMHKSKRQWLCAFLSRLRINSICTLKKM